MAESEDPQSVPSQSKAELTEQPQDPQPDSSTTEQAEGIALQPLGETSEKASVDSELPDVTPGGDTGTETPPRSADTPPGDERPGSTSPDVLGHITATPSPSPPPDDTNGVGVQDSGSELAEVVLQEVPPVKAAPERSRRTSRLSGLSRSSVYDQKLAASVVPQEEAVEEDRDPHHINSDLTLTFTEIFAEPERSVHSIDCVWQTSERVFSAVKLWCYRILAIFCAVPCACVWGVTFAVLSVASIWICSPWLKAFRIFMVCFKKMFDYTMFAFAVPVFEAVGRIFSSIRYVNDQR